MSSAMKTSSTILYKFRSSTNFESVEMPGTSARLFDVKKAIIKAKNLDRGTGAAAPQLEFDLSVRNALTNEEYTDETMLLPRGTRLVVQRLPAARGHGLLARIARAEAGFANPTTSTFTGNTVPPGYFTIQSRIGDDDEFIDSFQNSSEPTPQQKLTEVDGMANGNDSEERELAALKAVTDQAGSLYRPHTSINRTMVPGKYPSAVPNISRTSPAISSTNPHFSANKIPNLSMPIKFSADPELREHEQKLAQPKKRATGIPRTFLSISGPATNQSDGTYSIVMDTGSEVDKETVTVRLQPNTIGFEALIQRGGGQSESGVGPGGRTRSLEYALKLTATTIPDHLQCGVCHSVVKNAMLVPWDTDGRAVCEVCMRDSLAKTGFKCPLTGIEGVSPDDLHPNHGLRKAADLFVRDVMDLMDQIILKQQADEEEEQKKEKDNLGLDGAATETTNNIYEEDTGGGIFASRKKISTLQKRKRFSDPTDIDDDFGGDVFAVTKGESKVGEGADCVQNRPQSKDQNLSENNFIDSMQSIDRVVSNKNIECLENDNSKVVSENQDSALRCAVGLKNTVAQDILDGVQGELLKENVMHNDHSSSHGAVDTSPVSNDGGSHNLFNDDGNTEEQIPHSEETHMEPISLGKPSALTPSSDRRELPKNRGPPAGYKVGPAGGASVHGGIPLYPPPPIIPDTSQYVLPPTSENLRFKISGHGDIPPSRGHGLSNGREGHRGRGRGGRHFSSPSRGRGFRAGFGQHGPMQNILVGAGEGNAFPYDSTFQQDQREGSTHVSAGIIQGDTNSSYLNGTMRTQVQYRPRESESWYMQSDPGRDFDRGMEGWHDHVDYGRDVGIDPRLVRSFPAGFGDNSSISSDPLMIGHPRDFGRGVARGGRSAGMASVGRGGPIGCNPGVESGSLSSAFRGGRAEHYPTSMGFRGPHHLRGEREGRGRFRAVEPRGGRGERGRGRF